MFVLVKARSYFTATALRGVAVPELRSLCGILHCGTATVKFIITAAAAGCIELLQQVIDFIGTTLHCIVRRGMEGPYWLLQNSTTSCVEDHVRIFPV